MLKMQIKNVQLLRKLAKGLLRSPSSPFGFPSHETMKTIELPKSLILFSHRNCTGIFSQKWVKTTNLNLLWTKMYTSQIDNWQANSQKWTHRHKKCRQIYCKQKWTQVKTEYLRIYIFDKNTEYYKYTEPLVYTIVTNFCE